MDVSALTDLIALALVAIVTVGTACMAVQVVTLTYRWLRGTF